MVATNLWHLGWVHMVGATSAAAAAIVNGCYTLMAVNQQSPPLPFMWGNCLLASSAQACILQLFQAYHSESICGQVYRYSPTFQSPELPKHTFSHTKGSLQPDGLPLHIWRVLTLVSGTQHSPSSVSTMLGPEWFIKPHIKAYNTLSNGIFPSATVIEYFNVITSSPLFQKSTHPGVASALCSTLGTTPYFSVSLSLLVSRVQVAFHLYL
jgi:hypothetical protein